MTDNVSGKHYGLLIPYHNGDVRNTLSAIDGVVVVVIVTLWHVHVHFHSEILR